MNAKCEREDVRTASMRLDKITSEALEALSSRQGVSQSDVVRRLVLSAYVAGQGGWDDAEALAKARDHLISGCAIRGKAPPSEGD